MNIILEGSDNSGKSTLAECIARILNWGIVASEGPTRTPQEFNDRATRFLSLDRTIFDRHCIVSEYVYGTMRGGIMTDPALERMFYAASHVIIYCRSLGAPSLEGHIAKSHDRPDHLALIAAKQAQIHQLYDQWALEHAHIVYRKGETPMRIVRFLSGELTR